MPSLLMTHGGRSYGLVFNGTVRIGRDGSNDLVIKNDYTGLRHATIKFHDGRWRLSDCGSGNPIFINRRMLKPKAQMFGLSDGDVLTIGTIEMVFRNSHAFPPNTVRIPWPKAVPAKTTEKSITFKCSCGAAYQVAQRHAGRQAKCKACGKLIRVPAFSSKASLVKNEIETLKARHARAMAQAEARVRAMEEKAAAAMKRAEELAERLGNNKNADVVQAKSEASAAELAVEQARNVREQIAGTDDLLILPASGDSSQPQESFTCQAMANQADSNIGVEASSDITPPTRSSDIGGKIGSEEGDLAAVEIVCSVCQCTIDPSDEKMVCSQCGLSFHKECWEQNYGCSAYGCSQVGILKQGPDIKVSAAFPPPLPGHNGSTAGWNTQEKIPWWVPLFVAITAISILLGYFSSAVTSLVAMLVFGVIIGVRTGWGKRAAFASICMLICGAANFVITLAARDIGADVGGLAEGLVLFFTSLILIEWVILVIVLLAKGKLTFPGFRWVGDTTEDIRTADCVKNVESDPDPETPRQAAAQAERMTLDADETQSQWTLEKIGRHADSAIGKLVSTISTGIKLAKNTPEMWRQHLKEIDKDNNSDKSGDQ